ncbi:MAG: heat-inducible transcriptional repressor HrcA [Bacillota bacterium]
MTMDERKQKVLLAIIQDYIATAEPVGSRTISRKYELGVSPATIRNEMADLEEQGYIEQPHTSAGRVPSQLGYRYYVDCLMKKRRITKDEERIILSGYRKKSGEIAQVLRQTNHILSSMTSCASLVTGPQLEKSAFKHIQLVALENGRALVVVVLDNGIVQNKLIEIPEGITGDDLLQISQVLNAKLKGLTLANIKMTLIKEIYAELAKHQHIFDAAMDLIQETLHIDPEDKVYLAGTLNMLNKPEFRDISRLKTLLGLLEQDGLLREVLTEAGPGEDGIMVKIGSENRLSGLENCSMITATYQVDGRVVGSIGVLGPTRMEYDKTVGIVEFMTQHLSNVLKDFYK